MHASGNASFQLVLVPSPSTASSHTVHPQKAGGIIHASKDHNGKTLLRTSPEFSPIYCHERITWDLHYWAISEIIFCLLEINFWWSHMQMENHGLKIYTQQIKFTSPERQKEGCHFMLPNLHCLSPFGTHTRRGTHTRTRPLRRDSFLLCQLCFIKALFSLWPLSSTSVKFI